MTPPNKVLSLELIHSIAGIKRKQACVAFSPHFQLPTRCRYVAEQSLCSPMNTHIFQPCVLLSWMLVLSGALAQNSCTSDEVSLDDCQFRFDSICRDARFYCPSGTDCFDCDPCQDYSFTSCQNCTANGCVWCGMDAICVGAEILIQLEPPPSFITFTCTAEDFKNTCDSNSSNVFPDPLYDAQSWIYDQINVEEVWRAGISKCRKLQL